MKKSVDIFDMKKANKEAERFFVESDPMGFNSTFGKCQTMEDINQTAKELYNEFFPDDEE